MKDTPKGFRLHIGMFGRRNVGKSSLLNALTRQQVSIVSEVAGTTTDPVEKPMELLPIGPVLFIDTAGIDDAGALGELRVQKTRQVFDRTDVGIVVAEAGQWGPFEDADRRRNCRAGASPTIVVFNKTDLAAPAPELLAALAARKIPTVGTVASRGQGVLDLREALIRAAPEEFINAPAIVGDLVPARRAGGAGGAHRPGGAQGPADPAAGAGHPRRAGRRLLLHGRQGARTARRPGPPEAAARPGGHRFAGLPQGGRRHARTTCR